MRSYDEYKRILLLWEEGFNKSEIERRTGIPRPTIYDCIKRYGSLHNLITYEQAHEHPILFKILTSEMGGDHRQILEAYAYLFGLYLGDGNIVKARRIYRLRVTLDAKYPGIINRCVQAGQTLLPDNQIGVQNRYREDRVNCVDVSIYHKDLLLFFPQHGEGRKHTRKIELEAWQQKIVDTYPLEFFRGLYHSDGSRFNNHVYGRDYPRYQFTNTSSEIAQIFCNTCDQLGLHWTIKSRRNRANIVQDIYISKRKDVVYLDRVIGPKT